MQVAELPIWAHVETEAEEADRLAKHFAASPVVSRIVALETVHALKELLDATPRWRLLKRWLIVRRAKQIATEAGLVG